MFSCRIYSRVFLAVGGVFWVLDSLRPAVGRNLCCLVSAYFFAIAGCSSSLPEFALCATNPGVEAQVPWVFDFNRKIAHASDVQHKIVLHGHGDYSGFSLPFPISIPKNVDAQDFPIDWEQEGFLYSAMPIPDSNEVVIFGKKKRVVSTEPMGWTVSALSRYSYSTGLVSVHIYHAQSAESRVTKFRTCGAKGMLIEDSIVLDAELSTEPG